MQGANVLLITRDSILAKAARTAIGLVPNCVLKVESDPERACEWIRHSCVDVLMVHQATEEGFSETLSFLQSLSACNDSLATVVISDSDDADEAAQFVGCGVIECLHSRLDISRLASLIEILTSRRNLLHCDNGAPIEVASHRGPCVAELSINQSKSKFLFNTSGDFAELMEQVRRVAPSMTSVLLLGETGVGKTCLARVIHSLSSRHDEPFVTVNCGALSPGLIESELLGHVRGAFTGALRDHDGKMKLAGRGTLLLDEIDSLPMTAQASLLRAIDERVFEPVGSTHSHQFKARLIVATNRDLESEIAARRFREDLYYRINVVSFRLSPLRERAELVQRLAEQFLNEFAKRDGRVVPRLNRAASAALLARDWPGNIRELRNVIERASSLCTNGLITASDLSSHDHRDRSNGHEPVAKSNRTHWIRQREDAEVDAIRRALENANNNRAKAARDLGMSRVTLYKKLHKYHLLGFN